MNTEDTSNSQKTLDDVFKSADLSDRVWIFFTRYSYVLASIAIVVAIILSVIIVTIIGRNICKRSMKAAYLEAMQTDDTENRKRFAQKYISSQLGGSIFLKLGDEAYKKQEYRQAANYYHHACIGLGKDIFGGRAAIGEGVALAKVGLQSESEAIFTKIAEEKSYPSLICGNAMYLLAISIYERKDIGKAKSTLHQLLGGHFSDQWKNEAKVLLHEIEIAQ